MPKRFRLVTGKSHQDDTLRGDLTNKLFKHIKIYLKPFLNWKFAICFLIPWMLTNGIWYAGLLLGIKFHLTWLESVCGAYLVWLYSPLAMEKLVIIPVAIWLARILFKNDEKTQKDLQAMYEQAKSDFQALKQRFRKGKQNARRKRKRNGK